MKHHIIYLVVVIVTKPFGTQPASIDTGTHTPKLRMCTLACNVLLGSFSQSTKSHMFKHWKISHFPCSYHGCKKAFKMDWNRCARERSHQNKETKCNHCDYTTTDLRYLKQHECVHSDTPTYMCKNCNKGFWFYKQKKWHNKKGCKLNIRLYIEFLSFIVGTCTCGLIVLMFFDMLIIYGLQGLLQYSWI